MTIRSPPAFPVRTLKAWPGRARPIFPAAGFLTILSGQPAF